MNELNIKKENIANNISTVLLGTLLTAFISFFGASVIIRLLGAKNYALLNIALSIPSMFILVSDLGLSVASIRFVAKYKHSGNKYMLKKVIKISLVFSFFISLIFTFSLLLFSKILTIFVFNSLDYLLLVQIAIFGIFSTIVYNITLGILNGLEKMKYVSFAMILQASIRSIVPPILALYYSYVGAVLGFVIAPFIVSLFNLYIIYKNYPQTDHNVSTFISQFKILKNMILFGFPISIAIEPLTYQVYNILLNQYVSLIEIGNFNVVTVFSSLILILIRPFDKSLYPTFSKTKIDDFNKSDFNELYNTFCKQIALLISPLIFIVALSSSLLIKIFVGSSYELATLYLPYYMLYFVGVAFGNIVLHTFLRGQGHSILSLLLSISSLFLSIPFSLLLIPYIRLFGVYISLSFSVLITTLFGHYIVKRKFKLKIYINILFKIFMSSLLSFIIIKLSENFLFFITNTLILIIIKIIIYLFIYSIILILTNSLSIDDLTEIEKLYSNIPLLSLFIKYIAKFEKYLINKLRKESNT